MSGRVHATVKLACIRDCAVRVVLVYLMRGTQTCTKFISVLVPLRKEMLYLSWFILLCRPFTAQSLSTLHQFTSPGTVLLAVSDLPINIRY